ncbi:MAG TPA: hypothetical protein VFZ18_15915 [Longimicrobiaceae bacterium]
MRSLLRDTGVGAGGRRWGRWSLVAAGLLGTTACDVESLVELNNPDLITPAVVADTANLPTLALGVIYEFSTAYGGIASNSEDPGIIQYSGLLADEIWHSSTFTTNADIDARNIADTNGQVLGVYTYMQRARNLAERAAESFADSPRENSDQHALMLALAGYTYVYFAESFCSGVPFSATSFGGDVEYGEQLTTVQTLDRAIEIFTQALTVAQASGDDDMINLIRVGLGRAHLNKGDVTAAASAVAAVPTDFSWSLEFGDPPNPNNGVWFWINSANRLSVASEEGVNGLDYFDRGNGDNTTDPRNPADSVGVGLGQQTPQYNQGLYEEPAAGLVVATGVEARLIEAEAALADGSSTAYVPILNALRDEMGLSDLIAPLTAAGRVDQLFEERARWLWLTAHRLGDLRRLVRDYGRAADDVFPIGQTVFGEEYGDDTSLPIPFDERNNPLYSGQCLAE